MRDPLNKRLPRQFINDLGKYLVIVILMAFSIALEAGYEVGNGSMIKAYNDSFAKFNIEDGKFETKKKMNLAQKKKIEENGITIYENFYISLNDDKGRIYRLFKNRKDVDLIDIFEGTVPEKENEIALDRAFCANNNLKLNDTIKIEGQDYKLCGKIALSDYSALFADNSDIMFDAVSFSVGILSDQQFEKYRDCTWNYAYLYENRPINEEEERKTAEDLSKKINSEIALNSFTPRYLNQAINFTGVDMGGDKGMMEILFVIIIVIMAFVFAVTASNTIQKEMSVIGTLLASGYTKKELIIHYLKLPLIVTVFSAIIGNILGYTWMKDVVVNLYYNSYSLPTYQTIFSLDALVKTTLIPLVMMIIINLAVLSYKLNMPILNFLRRVNTSSLNKRAFPLNKKIPFMIRYRLRIFLKNIPSYLVMLVGILFANLLILFGLDFPKLIDLHEEQMVNHPLAEYITMLDMPSSMNREDHKLETSFEMLDFYNAVSTENETAEKFSAYNLKTLANPDISYNGETVTVYGVENDSKFIDLDFSNHQIYISRAYADKFELKENDEIKLKEEYGDKIYRFSIDGTYDYLGSLCIFMSREDLNVLFDMDKDTFVGYFSQIPIEDIDDRYIGTRIDENSLTKLSRQLRVSFGGMMDMVIVFAIVIYVVLIYVLCKMMIEAASQSISMSKIMGYTNKEISSLYIVTTFIVFLILLLGSMPIEIRALVVIFRYMMTAKMSGWFPLSIPGEVIMKTVFIAIASYVIVLLLELRRINRIPMDQALKNVE